MKLALRPETKIETKTTARIETKIETKTRIETKVKTKNEMKAFLGWRLVVTLTTLESHDAWTTARSHETWQGCMDGGEAIRNIDNIGR